jgi:hypothetical protein
MAEKKGSLKVVLRAVRKDTKMAADMVALMVE